MQYTRVQSAHLEGDRSKSAMVTSSSGKEAVEAVQLPQD